MKIRILPILLLMGMLVFGLTQSDPYQATSPKTTSQTVVAANPTSVTPAITTTTPTTPAISASAGVKTPTIDPYPTWAATTSPSTGAGTGTSASATLNTAKNIEKGAVQVGPAFQQFLEDGGAVGETPDNREAAEASGVEKARQRIVAEQSAVDSAYGQFDLSQLRLANLLSNSELHTASLDGSDTAEPIKISAQLNLGSSGVIPDATTQLLAVDPAAPKLWPVKGPVTSTFGPRQALTIPATTDNAAGKGGAGPTTLATAQSVTLQAITPTPTASASTHASATTTVPVTPTPTAAPTATHTSASPAPATATSSPITPSQQGTATAPQTATPTATNGPTPTLTAVPTATTAPATTGNKAATSPETTPTATETITPTPTPALTATPTISATTTVSPTVTPTATPFPTGPVPTINGSLPGVGGNEEYHTGLDIAVPEGTEVHATADGVVVYAGNGGGYGRVVYIQHANGFMTVYGHNSKLLVSAGQTVKAGQTISLSGSTGYSTGPHVHYEVRYNGKIMDPAYFLGLKG